MVNGKGPMVYGSSASLLVVFLMFLALVLTFLPSRPPRTIPPHGLRPGKYEVNPAPCPCFRCQEERYRDLRKLPK